MRKRYVVCCVDTDGSVASVLCGTVCSAQIALFSHAHMQCRLPAPAPRLGHTQLRKTRPRHRVALWLTGRPKPPPCRLRRRWPPAVRPPPRLRLRAAGSCWRSQQSMAPRSLTTARSGVGFAAPLLPRGTLGVGSVQGWKDTGAAARSGCPASWETTPCRLPCHTACTGRHAACLRRWVARWAHWSTLSHERWTSSHRPCLLASSHSLRRPRGACPPACVRLAVRSTKRARAFGADPLAGRCLRAGCC